MVWLKRRHAVVRAGGDKGERAFLHGDDTAIQRNFAVGNRRKDLGGQTMNSCRIKQIQICLEGWDNPKVKVYMKWLATEGGMLMNL